ncbi:hypothetical protein SAXI111661_14050 [Saccharomonospora xinjiangensis]
MAGPSTAARPQAGRQREPGAERERIRRLTTERLARALRVPVAELSSRTAFAELGVDSITGMSFVSELGEELGIELDAALLYDHTTIDRLTDYLAEVVTNTSGGQR